MSLLARLAARSRWPQRLAAVLGLAGLIGAVPPALAARQQLEARVQVVRAALQVPSKEAVAAEPLQRLAQWMNWPNWSNWANWNNWNNWPNWGNWGNWFNR